jgi:hypothetical protein
LFDPGNSLGWINQSPGQVTVEESQEVRGNADLGTVEWRQKEAGLAIDGFGNEMLLLTLELDRLLNDRHGDFQEGRCCLNQFIVVDGTVPILGKFLEDMTHASLGTDHGIPWNP